MTWTCFQPQLNTETICRLMYKRMQLTSLLVWLKKGWNAVDMASQLLLLVLLFMRLAGQHTVHIKFFISSAACCAVLLWSKMLFFMMPFSTTGAIVSAVSTASRPPSRVDKHSEACDQWMQSECTYFDCCFVEHAFSVGLAIGEGKRW
jgi:hypothetical protein